MPVVVVAVVGDATRIHLGLLLLVLGVQRERQFPAFLLQ